MAKKAESGGYARLKGDLAQKTPGSFYVLYGEEDYLRRYYLPCCAGSSSTGRRRTSTSTA